MFGPGGEGVAHGVEEVDHAPVRPQYNELAVNSNTAGAILIKKKNYLFFNLSIFGRRNSFFFFIRNPTRFKLKYYVFTFVQGMSIPIWGN